MESSLKDFSVHIIHIGSVKKGELYKEFDIASVELLQLLIVLIVPERFELNNSISSFV